MIAYDELLIQEHNFRADVVIIDYCDLLAPETAALKGDSYATGREVYSTWRAWMQERGIPGWTGMQSGREAMNAKYADQQHSGGSIAKPQTADVQISINRSDTEVLDDRVPLELYVVKNREGKAKITINITADFSRMQFALNDGV